MIDELWKNVSRDRVGIWVCGVYEEVSCLWLCVIVFVGGSGVLVWFVWLCVWGMCVCVRVCVWVCVCGVWWCVCVCVCVCMFICSLCRCRLALFCCVCCLDILSAFSLPKRPSSLCFSCP